MTKAKKKPTTRKRVSVKSPVERKMIYTGPVPDSTSLLLVVNKKPKEVKKDPKLSFWQKIKFFFLKFFL